MEKKNRPGATTRVEVVALILIVLLAVAIRLNLVDIPLNRDEGGFAYFGNLLDQGGLLYQDGFDHKPPGIWLWYRVLAFVMAFDAVRLHLVLLAYNLLTLLLVVMSTGRLFSVGAALWAGLVYAVASSSWQVEGFSASAEMFMLLPIMGSLLLSILGMETRRWPFFVLSGSLASCYIWMKQPAVVISLFQLLYILAWSFKDSLPGQSPRDRLLKGVSRALAFSAGVALPSLVLCGYFAADGRWDAFIYWSFSHSLDYAVTFSTWTYLHNIWVRLVETMAGNPFAWVLALATCLLLPFFRPKEGFVVLGFFLSSLLAACHSPFMYRHYMALVVPSLSIAAGVGASVLVERVARNKVLHALSVMVLVACFVAVPVIRDRHYYLLNTPGQTSRVLFDLNPFPESPVVANYIRMHTKPKEPILVLGSEPQILVLADRPSATRHVFMYQVVGPYRKAARFQQEVLQDIMRNRPSYVVAVSVQMSWLSDPKESDQFARKVNQWLSDNYELEALVNLDGRRPALIKVADTTEEEKRLLLDHEHIAIFRRLAASE